MISPDSRQQKRTCTPGQAPTLRWPPLDDIFPWHTWPTEATATKRQARPGRCQRTNIRIVHDVDPAQQIGERQAGRNRRQIDDHLQDAGGQLAADDLPRLERGDRKQARRCGLRARRPASETPRTDTTISRQTPGSDSNTKQHLGPFADVIRTPGRSSANPKIDQTQTRQHQRET